MSNIPNPGSSEAIEQGCTCPVLDNNHGEGVMVPGQSEPQFWQSAGCILHGVIVPAKKETPQEYF